MIPNNIHALLNEDMTGILDYCDTVSLSATEEISRSTNTSGTDESIVGMLSASSCRETLTWHESHIESCFKSTGASVSAPKQFIFEFSDEFRRQEDVQHTPFAEEHHYISSAHDDHSMSDISESVMSDDDTFSFVAEEEDLDLTPYANSNFKNPDNLMLDDCMRASILTWTSQFSLLEDPQLVRGASIMLTLAR